MLGLTALFIASGIRLDRSAVEVRARWANASSRFVDIDGAQVHYRDEGRGDAIVLLHGTGASLHTWDAWTEHLSARYRVVRLDLPGFGLTGPDGSHDYSMPRYVRLLEKFLASTDIRRAHIVGNSFGGQIAWHFVLAHPERVASLVLIDSAGYPKPMPFMLKLARMPVTSTLFRWVSPQVLLRMTLRDVYVDDGKVTDALVDRYYDMLLRDGNRDAFRERVKTDFPDDTAALRTIRTPTLILWGQADPWIPVEFARRYHRDIAGSKLIVYPNAGHMPMEELGEESASDVERFFVAHRSN